ncbi:alkaline phosphatase family protein [Companilactobacillus ginsenosidimutans]|uniref:alkaline phosphatase family protein n=1 Tax=Companilactobacillus ginsenosidimutans TaxID=1007676 RepID=UPI0007DC40DB|nr:alkaline phosphatase family protein [Companilactobacillus ginsenosidimutans]
MKPRILTTLLICTATLTTTVTPAIAAVVPETEATVQTPAAMGDTPSSQQSEDQTNVVTTTFTNEDIQGRQSAPMAVEQTVETRLVGPKQIAAGAIYGLNVHARQLKEEKVRSLSFDIVYNSNKFSYINSDRTLKGNKTVVTKVDDGRLRITTTAELSDADFLYYAKTRLAHINFRAIEGATGKADIHFEQPTDQGTIQLGSSMSVDIQAQDPLDYNGDGIIGVGDIALAPENTKSEIAARSEIKPYKHVIVLTTDGGGNPWDPNGIFYATGTGKEAGKPVWTTDPNLMKKRKNTYTMNLFNKQFAMSTSAHSVVPAISAQNYISMLHGRPWDTLPKAYQGTNGTMGQQYFADFGKGTPLFPSVFKVLQKNNPTQKAAAFSEWGPIVNSIVEPDAAVTTKQSASLKSFDDVADYIGTSDFQNTSMVYMQSDYMDGQGHSKGWYNDNYWEKYQQYDGLFKKVMDNLEATGHIHDTLVIANADHGGAGTNHGPNDEPDRNIFMAVGGETVDSGRRLQGGSNADITALVLNALQVPQPSHMLDSRVFDESAFLSQSELTKKDRNVETVQLTRQGDTVELGLTNLKNRKINAVDMRIDLNGQNVDSLNAASGNKILRQTIDDDILKLTISVDDQSVGSLATIKFKPSGNKNDTKSAVTQAMAATTDGTEILVDLDNNSDKTISIHASKKSVSLYDSDLKKATRRSLSGGTDWRSDKEKINDGIKYYRVSSNEWVSEKDAYVYTGFSKVLTTPKYKVTDLVNSNGEKIKNRGLASNTKWATDRSLMINGKLHYRVSTNEFVSSDNGRVD